jgi:predicted aspartyl protease
MARGYLTSHFTAVINVTIDDTVFEAVIDTGFSAGLLLPEYWRSLIPCIPVREARFEFPDGTIESYSIYNCIVGIEGSDHSVETIFCGENEAIIGTDLLRNFHLSIDYPKRLVILE